MRPASLRYRIGRLTAVAAIGLGVVFGSASLALADDVAEADTPGNVVASGAEAADHTAPDDFQWD